MFPCCNCLNYTWFITTNKCLWVWFVSSVFKQFALPSDDWLHGNLILKSADCSAWSGLCPKRKIEKWKMKAFIKQFRMANWVKTRLKNWWDDETGEKELCWSDLVWSERRWKWEAEKYGEEMRWGSLPVQKTFVKMKAKLALRWLRMPAGSGPLCSSCSLGLLTMKVLYCFAFSLRMSIPHR